MMSTIALFFLERARSVGLVRSLCLFLGVVLGPHVAGAQEFRDNWGYRGLTSYFESEKLPVVSLKAQALDCGDERCISFRVTGVSRDDVWRLLPHVVGGMGFGARVHRVRMETDLQTVDTCSLEVVLPDHRVRVERSIGRQLGEAMFVVFRTIGDYSTPSPQEFHPSTTGPSQRIYFVESLDWTRGVGTTVNLLSPPDSPDLVGPGKSGEERREGAKKSGGKRAENKKTAQKDTEPSLSVLEPSQHPGFSGWKRWEVKFREAVPLTDGLSGNQGLGPREGGKR